MSIPGQDEAWPVPARNPAEGALAGRSDYVVAAGACGLLALFALGAILRGNAAGPQLVSYVPVVAAFCSFAGLLTAFFLFAQFYVAGSMTRGILACAYGLSALLKWPYLAAFPGAFHSGAASLGDQQISVYLWTIWQWSFPALVIYATVKGPAFGRIVSRARVEAAGGALAGLTLVGACALASLVYVARAVLPPLVVAGRFQPLFREAFIWIGVILSVTAIIVLLRRKPVSTLRLWLTVTLCAEALELVPNAFASSRYSYGWYAAHAIAAAGSSVLLVVMLREVVRLYARLERMARTDALTALPNRRAFEDHLTLMLNIGRRSGHGIGLLGVDDDLFKRFNEAYGHLAGDECLRAIAQALSQCATRPLDLVARYGGEEFALLLPETPRDGVLAVAERVRESVERLDPAYDGKPLRKVTVSIGVAFAANANEVDEGEL